MLSYNSGLVLAEPGSSYQFESERQWVEVLVDCPGAQGLFTYRLPSDLAVQPGDILSVPFGTQITGGVAIRLLQSPPPNLASESIREVEDVVTSGFFPSTYWQLIHRVAQYYHTDLMAVIRVALPPGLLGRSQRRVRLKAEAVPQGAEAFCSTVAGRILNLLQSQKAGDYSVQYLQRQIRGASRGLRELFKRGWVESYLEPPRTVRPKRQKAVTLVINASPLNLTERQREILEVLRHRGGELWLNQLLQVCRTSTSVIDALQRKGCVVVEYREKLRLLAPAATPDRAKQLTSFQTEALQAIRNLTGFAQVLLHGITGSGKTEVYLQAIAPILESGRSALVLVPEIGLTPQLTDRFRARFGNQVCVYHSALSEGERYDTWRQMLAGEPQVAIGTRSAIFAPLPSLGLIVLDEEHDSSFKQSRPAPTYHARTVAKWRAELADCPLILGSATPSLETWVESKGEGSRGLQVEKLNVEGFQNNLQPANLQPSPPSQPANQQPSTQSQPANLKPATPSQPATYYLSLPERIQSRPLPPVEIADMRRELQSGNRSIFSRSLAKALEQLQEEKQQGILFISRRGHSTFVSCRSCGYVIECPHCDVSLSYHRTHEGATELLRCHYCNYSRLQPRDCPECGSPYLKFFGSGTQRVAMELKRQFPQLRTIRFDSDTTRTKGAHRHLIGRFARGEADVLVGTQMLTKGLDLAQVTLVGVVAADGLLHRSDYRASEQAFQTLTQVAGRAGRGQSPGRVIIQTYTPEHPVIEAVKQHDYRAFAQAELETRCQLDYPPYGTLVLIRLSGIDEAEVQQTAVELADALISLSSEAEILGPAPANVMRVARRYRWQILLKYASSQPRPDFTQLRTLCPQSVSLTIDVDPLNID